MSCKMHSFIFKILKAPFIIYGDFECLFMPSTDNIDFGPNTKKYQDHVVCSYGYKLRWVDERYSESYKPYFGEDDFEKSLNNMIKESGYYSKVIEIAFW